MNDNEIGEMLSKFMGSFNLYFEIENTNYTDRKYFSHQSLGVIRYCTFVGKIKKRDTNEVVFSFSVEWGTQNGKIFLLDSYQIKSIDGGLFSYLGRDKEIYNYFVQKTKPSAEEWFEIFP
jgi:hypothetical protein